MLPSPPGPTADLVEALLLFRTDRCALDQLAGTLRATALVVPVSDEDSGVALLTARGGALAWLGVFTSLARMAEFHRGSGRGADEVRYAELTGAELLDQCLPALPRGTGLVIDPGTGHSTALGPVAGLVPDRFALTESGN
ncbi:SseB family protein [Saccharopolyspora sp. NPDC000359]|uniref:SseB family protein n=1 Tax=Saccharopolyspora sp. NPDC000359 TaxID=3154251 RepID=UPI00332C90AC